MAWQDDLTPKKRRKMQAQAANVSESNQIGGKSTQSVAVHFHPVNVGEQRRMALESMQEVLELYAGVWKVTTGDSGEMHLTFKFTSGAWKNHYVYWFKKPEETFSQATLGLCTKVFAVMEGKLKPTPDAYAR